MIRSYVPSFSAEKNLNITFHMETFANQKFGKPLSELAPVKWETTFLTRKGIRHLYQTVDCFVLPTRGEGWGLPIGERMSVFFVCVVLFVGVFPFCLDVSALLIFYSSTLLCFFFLSCVLVRLLSLQQWRRWQCGCLSSSPTSPAPRPISERTTRIRSVSTWQTAKALPTQIPRTWKR